MDTGLLAISYVIVALISYWIGYLHRFYIERDTSQWQKKRESRDG